MKTRIRIVTTLCFLTLLFLLPFTCHASEAPFQFTVIDVGQGQSVLISVYDQHMLIDGGGRASSSYLVSYLKQVGIEKLDYVAVSHYDEDHMSGTIGVLNVFPCEQVLLPPYSGDGDLYQSLAVAAISNGCDITHAEVGCKYYLGEAEIEAICPVMPQYANENDMSLGFRLSYGEQHFLVCGDAEQASELDMVASGEELQSDVYVVHHHGSALSTTDAFLDAVNPRYAVISCGKDNSYGHPAMETMQRLQNHNILIFRTDLQGTVTAFSDGYELWFNIEPSSDWNAGNFVIDMTDDENAGSVAVETNRTIHEEMAATDKTPESSYQYVCNTNTKKFHFPTCSSVSQMKDENRLYTELSRDELIAEGYKPCGNCNP